MLCRLCINAGLLIMAVVGIAAVVSVVIVVIGVACLCRSVQSVKTAIIIMTISIHPKYSLATIDI